VSGKKNGKNANHLLRRGTANGGNYSLGRLSDCLLKQMGIHLRYLKFRDKYLTAATYLSSRAFPSSLLSETPTLIGTPFTEPILIPGVDSLNHARGQPVSWVVTHPTKDDASQEAKISLVIRSPIASGQELFNNYGPKPNSELILGYGFSLPANPDDTIVLKVGGINGKKWEIGRNAQGVDGLWMEILSTLLEPGADPEKATYEDILDSAAMLQEMAQALIERLPVVGVPNGERSRPDVQKMFYHYIEGAVHFYEGNKLKCPFRIKIELCRTSRHITILDGFLGTTGAGSDRNGP